VPHVRKIITLDSISFCNQQQITKSVITDWKGTEKLRKKGKIHKMRSRIGLRQERGGESA